MDRPSLLHGPTGPPSLHGPALLLVPTIFPPGGFAIPCRYTLHHPYICPCFWRKHFYIPLFLHFLWNANYTWASQLLRLPNNSGNKGALHVPALLVAWTDCPPPPPPLFAWTGAPPCSYDFFARWFCHTLQVDTAPSLPKGQHHRHTHVSIVAQCGLFCTWASQLLRLPNNSGNKGTFSESWQGVSTIAQCGLCWVGSLG